MQWFIIFVRFSLGGAGVGAAPLERLQRAGSGSCYVQPPKKGGAGSATLAARSFLILTDSSLSPGLSWRRRVRWWWGTVRSFLILTDTSLCPGLSWRSWGRRRRWGGTAPPPCCDWSGSEPGPGWPRLPWYKGEECKSKIPEISHIS